MGIVESNDQEHTEKNKAMAILAKQYALHYLAQDHTHPSIPKGALYQAIDNPEKFQKYVGAGTEKTLKKRPPAVLETRDKYITYNDKIAFTPYFNCSPGITRLAKDVRGRNDTPYLKPVIDWSTASCDSFQGHGVGLAGKGAEYMAARGVTYKYILEYYYPGTKVK